MLLSSQGAKCPKLDYAMFILLLSFHKSPGLEAIACAVGLTGPWWDPHHLKWEAGVQSFFLPPRPQPLVLASEKHGARPGPSPNFT